MRNDLESQVEELREDHEKTTRVAVIALFLGIAALGLLLGKFLFG